MSTALRFQGAEVEEGDSAHSSYNTNQERLKCHSEASISEKKKVEKSSYDLRTKTRRLL